MTEVAFKPSLVGTVADGAITNAKICDPAGIAKTKLAALEIVNADVATGAAIAVSKVADAVAGTGTTADKKITKLGWNSATGEFVLDHEA